MFSITLDTYWYPAIQFSYDTDYRELVQPPQFKGPLCQMSITSSGSLRFPIGSSRLQIGGPHDLLLLCANLLRQLIELQEMLYFCGWFVTKDFCKGYKWTAPGRGALGGTWTSPGQEGLSLWSWAVSPSCPVDAFTNSEGL